MMQRVQETLSVERQKLEAELAGSREALARAQKQAREAAEAERRAAEQEAERVIAEYKNAHQSLLAEELDKLRAFSARHRAISKRHRKSSKSCVRARSAPARKKRS
jgi:colicin import membrane protein